MNTRFWCARCGRAYERPRELAGRRARCRSCGHVQTIPEPVEAGSSSQADGDLAAPSSYALEPVPPPLPVPITIGAPGPTVPVPDSRPRKAGRRRNGTWREQVRDLTAEAGHLQELSLLLLALSLVDLLVTYALLRSSPRFFESNPVALWVFRRWNIAGMAVFKLGAIALAIAIGEFVERRRPGWGKAVLVIGCAATAAVVWHGVRLYLGVGPGPMVEAGGD